MVFWVGFWSVVATVVVAAAVLVVRGGRRGRLLGLMLVAAVGFLLGVGAFRAATWDGGLANLWSLEGAWLGPLAAAGFGFAAWALRAAARDTGPIGPGRDAEAAGA